MQLTPRWRFLNRLYHGSSTLHPKPPLDHDSPGLVQFIRYDSTGVKPDDPHPYFRLLDGGKKWFNWHRTNLRLAFWGDERCDSPELFRWPGLLYLVTTTDPETVRELLNWWPDQDELERLILDRKPPPEEDHES